MELASGGEAVQRRSEAERPYGSPTTDVDPRETHNGSWELVLERMSKRQLSSRVIVANQGPEFDPIDENLR